jgi:hypothetical protein
MKTRFVNFFLRSAFIALCIAVVTPSIAQETGDFFTVEGVVRDADVRRPIAGVGIRVPDTGIGTVTNADGSFSIKIKHGLKARELEFSHLGYNLRRIPVTGIDRLDLSINLSAETTILPDVLVINHEARDIVEEAIRRIDINYSNRESSLMGFYRETVRKRTNYIDISEAVVEIYRHAYADEVRSDRLKVIKGRRLVSPRTSDTLSVKLQGGPTGYLTNDVILNREILLNPKELDNYRFRLEEPVTIDDRLHYTVAFEPAVIAPDYALFEGRLYIDRESLTISRAEYALDMSSPTKVTNMILRSKPASLRFTPREVSFTLDYRRRDEHSYLYYINVQMRFHCDWRRRLFSTGYTVSAETVITDQRDEGATQIPYREAFRSNQSLVDRVGDFYGPEFWEDYNIIEPTQSLEDAVDRLQRKSR